MSQETMARLTADWRLCNPEEGVALLIDCISISTAGIDEPVKFSAKLIMWMHLPFFYLFLLTQSIRKTTYAFVVCSYKI